MAIALVIITCLAYSPALRAPFQFDDLESISGNITIRSLWPPSVPLHPPPGIAVSGRPVVNYSLALNYALNERLGVDQRPDPDGANKTLGYRIVNLLLHLASGALLFGILRRTLRTERLAKQWSAHADPVAAIVTALWLLHPIQTEAVNYVVQRTELMVSACYLGTLYAAIRAWDASSARAMFGWSAAAIAACLLGMGSKEVMITAPLMVPLYDRAFRAESWSATLGARRGRAWFYLLLAATSVWSFSLILAGSRHETVGFSLGVTWYQYLYSQAWAIVHYIRLVIWPDQLTYDYGQEPITGLRGVPGLLLLTGLGVATIVAWRRAPALAFAGTWFFLILAPSSSFVPIRTEIAAERRFYLPLVSVLVLLAVGVQFLRRQAEADHVRRWWHVLVRGERRWLLAGLCLLLAMATFQRSRLYADPEALWRDAVAKSPRNPRAYDNLATALLHQQPPRLAEAESTLRRAIAIDSTYLPAWPNLAGVVFEQGRQPEARQILEHVVATNPSFVRGVERLGVLLAVTGEPAAALPHLERVVTEFPSDEDLLALGTVYMALDRPADAVPKLEQVVRGGSGSGFAYALLSMAYAQTGRASEAVDAATTAGAVGGGDASVYMTAGRAMLVVERPAEAEKFFTEAVRLSPTDPEAITRLGIVTAALGKRDEAAQLFRRALTLQPDYVPARRSLDDLRPAPGPGRPD